MKNSEKNKRISVICACNNDDVYNRMLLSSLQKQTYDNYEVLKLDAKRMGLDSAAAALNYGASISNGEILVFVHQDVEFLDEKALSELAEYCEKYDFGIAGVAGATVGGEIYSSVTNGFDRVQAGKRITGMTAVDTLDECLLIVKKSQFVGFIDYGSWHFYGVEYSLRCKNANKKVMLFPISVYHLSPGWSLDKTYWITLKKGAKAHRECKVIPTTMGQYKNNALLELNIFYRRIKRKLKKVFKKT